FRSGLVDVPRLLLFLRFFSIHSAVRRPIAFDRKKLPSARSPMKHQRFAAAALAALFTLAACAENPVAPVSNPSYAANSPSVARGAASSYTFTRIDVPGATATQPSGINAGGRVVGWYMQGGVTRGFIYDAGAWTT